jgi:hypothetical protein
LSIFLTALTDLLTALTDLFFAASSLSSDVYVYDPALMAWTYMSAYLTGNAPSGRQFHGIAAAANRLYVFGGSDSTGTGLYEGERAYKLSDFVSGCFRYS